MQDFCNSQHNLMNTYTPSPRQRQTKDRNRKKEKETERQKETETERVKDRQKETGHIQKGAMAICIYMKVLPLSSVGWR